MSEASCRKTVDRNNAMSLNQTNSPTPFDQLRQSRGVCLQPSRFQLSLADQDELKAILDEPSKFMDHPSFHRPRAEERLFRKPPAVPVPNTKWYDRFSYRRDDLEAQADGGEPYNPHFRTKDAARLMWTCLQVARHGPGQPIPRFPGDQPAKPIGRRKASGGSIFERVKAAVSVEDLAGRYTDLRSAGPGKLKGKCPIHEERTPSFYVFIDREPQSWRCFGACATGGDVVELAYQLSLKGRL